MYRKTSALCLRFSKAPRFGEQDASRATSWVKTSALCLKSRISEELAEDRLHLLAPFSEELNISDKGLRFLLDSLLSEATSVPKTSALCLKIPRIPRLEARVFGLPRGIKTSAPCLRYALRSKVADNRCFWALKTRLLKFFKNLRSKGQIKIIYLNFKAF